MANAKSIYDKWSKQCHKSCNYFSFSLWNLLSPIAYKEKIHFVSELKCLQWNLIVNFVPKKKQLSIKK